jgi:hypothetical protein
MTETLNVVGKAEEIEKLENIIIETYNVIHSHDQELASKWYNALFNEDGSVKGDQLNEITLMILNNDVENVTTTFEDEEDEVEMDDEEDEVEMNDDEEEVEE